MEYQEIPEEYEHACPKCLGDITREKCREIGCEDGYHEYEDGLTVIWNIQCDSCLGTGFATWCRECGWDAVYQQFLSPKYEAEFLAKQAAENPAVS